MPYDAQEWEFLSQFKTLLEEMQEVFLWFIQHFEDMCRLMSEEKVPDEELRQLAERLFEEKAYFPGMLAQLRLLQRGWRGACT